MDHTGQGFNGSLQPDTTYMSGQTYHAMPGFNGPNASMIGQPVRPNTAHMPHIGHHFANRPIPNRGRGGRGVRGARGGRGGGRGNLAPPGNMNRPVYATHPGHIAPPNGFRRPQQTLTRPTQAAPMFTNPRGYAAPQGHGFPPSQAHLGHGVPSGHGPIQGFGPAHQHGPLGFGHAQTHEPMGRNAFPQDSGPALGYGPPQAPPGFAPPFFGQGPTPAFAPPVGYGPPQAPPGFAPPFFGQGPAPAFTPPMGYGPPQASQAFGFAPPQSSSLTDEVRRVQMGGRAWFRWTKAGRFYINYRKDVYFQTGELI